MAGNASPESRGTEAAPTLRLGWLCLAIVTGKAAWEAVTGQVFFTWLHFGLLGTPVAVCHLGGVVGGVIAWSARRRTCDPD